MQPLVEGLARAEVEVVVRRQAIYWFLLDHMRRQQVVLRGQQWRGQGSYSSRQYCIEVHNELWSGYLVQGGEVDDWEDRP